MGRRKVSVAGEIGGGGGGGSLDAVDPKIIEEAAKTPSYLKRPFGNFRGLTRDNTVIGTPGLPYAWGFTYNTPYKYSFVKKTSDFDIAKLHFDYMASSMMRGIRQMKHEVNMLKFFKNPIFSRRQRAIQALDDWVPSQTEKHSESVQPSDARIRRG